MSRYGPSAGLKLRLEDFNLDKVFDLDRWSDVADVEVIQVKADLLRRDQHDRATGFLPPPGALSRLALPGSGLVVINDYRENLDAGQNWQDVKIPGREARPHRLKKLAIKRDAGRSE